MSLTENGELLLPVIRKFLRQEDRIFELSAEMNGLLIGSVNIAAYSSIATHWLPAMCREPCFLSDRCKYQRKKEAVSIC